MNVQKNYRKAWIAFTASFSCLLIYVLACVMSPPSWSPDSSKIAVLVTPPGNKPDMYVIFIYDILTDKHILLDEVKADGSLSAPAWSPDGKWIAYYKVEPTNQPESILFDSNSAPSADQQIPTENSKINEPADTQEIEENNILPSFLFELVENQAKNNKKNNFINLKLMLVRPDGSERKTLNTFKLQDENGNENMSPPFLQPVWSKDSKRVFYIQGYEDLWYAGNIDISTGKTYLNLLTSGSMEVSPDNKWIASFIKDNNTLVIADVDGNMCKYYKLDFEIKNENLVILDGMFWSPDSKKIFITDKESSLYSVDALSGQSQLLIASDPNNNNVYYTLSSTGRELYYLSNLKSGNSNVNQEKIQLKYLNLRNNSKGTLFTFQLPDLSDEPGIFSIAPNGKIVLLRATIKNTDEIERSAMIFFDGKTQKTVETDRWLLQPLISR